MPYKLFDKKLFDSLKKEAYDSSRKRAHYNIHNSYDELVQKVLICLLSDTYIPPHYHKNSSQKELFIVLKGIIKIVLFNNDGTLKEVFLLGKDYDLSMIEIFPNTIHTVVCISKEAFILEIKQGPFLESDSKKFPYWSIPESDVKSKEFLEEMKK